jgi:pSer/pThr/pTyr-binding forkhead associated (FHA) protein
MDLGSTNGVFVDDRLRLEARLKDGEEFRLGKTRLRFQLVEGSKAAESGDGGLLDASAETGPIVRPDPSLDTLANRSTNEAVIDDMGPDHPAHRVDTQKFTRDDMLGALTASDGVQIIIEILEGADRGSVRHFKQESILIGRLNTDLVLRDSDVSRRHAIIEVFDATQVYLRDLNSTNGCRVNDNKVVSARLQNGDELRIGRSVLRFSAQVVYPEKS